MTELEKAIQHLTSQLQNHSSVLAFQKVEERLKELSELKDEVIQMKIYQQDVVLYQKIHKEKAAKQAASQADVLRQMLEDSPLVQDYRQKMQDASDLLQYVTQRLEDRINEELGNGKW
ncbi:YlbF family regulator [Streptococcus sciuri]|uniref:YlbF family regulator n=1 Tax=Streptococcus sciuri TaxID=2973939 RepID=A0ABT2F631_9STRE|nr:YlbF family regulator [Streptococcus sciuri]MCS4487928.1 YlbF family regulator [Streptococcus sciuri]